MDAIGDAPVSPTLYQRVYDAASNADLRNNSWRIGGAGAGYTLNASNQDDYVLDAIDTNGNVRDPFLTVFSAGNSGGDCGSPPCASSITEPKEAKNILVVGASLSRRSDTAGGLTGNISSLGDYSSRGPAVDGRLLPNLTTPGSNVVSTENRSVGPGGTVDFKCFTSPPNSTQHAYCSGTSMSSPHMTSAAALFTQFWRVRNNTTGEPEPATTKAALINATDDMQGGDNGWGTALGHRPDNHQGWGRANLDCVLNPPVAVQYFQNPDPLQATGEFWEIEVEANDVAQPLRVTLVWSDAPGVANANPARVNNLDLRLTAPGGTIYRGNVFSTSTGWSTSGGSHDTLNNVENVWLATPSSGRCILYISPGTYAERLGLIDKNLTLTAATADCTASAAGGVTIDANDAAATWGGVAEIATSHNVTFANLTLTDGSAQYGGILYVNGGATVVLDGSDLTFGAATDYGGGVRLILGATVELINSSQIYENETTGSGGDGGGVAVFNANLILRGDSRIGDYLDGNRAADQGGGVLAWERGVEGQHGQDAGTNSQVAGASKRP